MQTATRLDIAIIGGGPAGLMLGALLHKKGIPFTLFELRERPHDSEADEPAGTLDMHSDGGLLSLEAAGLHGEFLLQTADCSEEMIIADKSAAIIHRDMGQDEARPEISRNKLRALLYSAIPPTYIRWGHKLVSLKKITRGGRRVIELDFGLNGILSFDFVVGADGAWSKTRALLTDVEPAYSGYHNITLLLRQISSAHPAFSSLIGSGSYMALADHHGVCAQRATQDSARIYIFVSTKDRYFARSAGLQDMTLEQAREFLMGEHSPIKDWSDDIRGLVSAACEDERAVDAAKKLDIVPLYRLPIGMTWQHVDGVTIIGDAAHLLNPGAGDGANLGMRDALDVAMAISEALEDEVRNETALLDEKIKKVEEQMQSRAKESGRGTLWINQLMFGSKNGGEQLTQAFKTGSIAAPEDFMV